MQFELSRDFALVQEIVTHAAIYPHISDDASPSAEDWQPIDHPSIEYVVVRDGGEVLGLWLCVRKNSATLEVHTCLLPRAWGERAKQAAREMAAWIFAHTDVERISTEVPDYNRLALHFAKRAGMTEYGRNPRSYRKNGKLYDTILLGLSRPD
ncbi:MAG TPA: GNAT family protein [Bryobacteraceae bacterium]|nr:GNAT family protein [Bryobacteraceae bacterium]